MMKSALEKWRQSGYKMVDKVVDYYQNLEQLPVKSSVQPGFMKQILPKEFPKKRQSFEETINQMEQFYPGLTHWQHPMFFGFFPSQSCFTAIFSEMFPVAWNCPGFTWQTSPLHTELELAVCDWVASMLCLPEEFKHVSKRGGGIIHSTASEASLVAIIAGREKYITEANKNNLVSYISDQTHSSVKKNLNQVLRIPYMRVIPTKWNGNNIQMDVDALKQQIQQDLKQNLKPFFVCGTIGTTNTTGVDNLTEIGKISKEYDLWFHIDSAYAGSCLILEEFRTKYLNPEVISYIDSLNFNGHKMFLMSQGVSFLFVKDRFPVMKALTLTPEYLEHQFKDVTDLKDWQITLGRNFRSFKVWSVIQTYGLEGLQANLRNQINLARLFKEKVQADQRFELFTEQEFGLVTFRIKEEGEDKNVALIEKLNQRNDIFITPTKVQGKNVLRLAVCSEFCEERHINKAWEIIQSLV